MSLSIESPAAISAPPLVVPVVSSDGAHSALILVQPDDPPRDVMYWVPAMGVPAKHYLPWAQILAKHGVAMALHEWRGIGASDRRAGRHVDWGYRELLDADLQAGVAAAKARWPHAKFWMGGHSLGGQLSCLYASLHSRDVAGIALIASGAPYWKQFPFGRLIRVAYALASPLAWLVGYLPGRRIGFGGNEARGVIADWSHSGLGGRYSARGMDVDFERQLAALRLPVLGLRLRDDWLVPAASLQWLLDKMPDAPRQVGVVGPEQLAGQTADHFAWMKAPDVLAARLAEWIHADIDRP